MYLILLEKGRPPKSAQKTVVQAGQISAASINDAFLPRHIRAKKLFVSPTLIDAETNQMVVYKSNFKGDLARLEDNEVEKICNKGIRHPRNFTERLLRVYFTRDELLGENLNALGVEDPEKPGVPQNKLDPTRIQYIREHVMKHFANVSSNRSNEEIWNTCVKGINNVLVMMKRRYFEQNKYKKKIKLIKLKV